MTVIRPNSISGITSITAQANEINVFKSDGTLAGLSLNGVNVNTTSGISTYAALNVTGNVSVGGTLTYQDVTNVDAVGLITARAGVNVSGGQLDVGSNIKLGNAGVITATSFVGSGANLTGLTVPGGGTGLDLNDNVKIRLGTGNDLEIVHNGSKSLIRGTTATNIDIKTAADFFVTHADTDGSNGENCIVVRGDGEVELYHDGTKKLATAGHGINITGGFVATGDCSIADKITHAGDENTSIRFPAADTFSVETAGSERLRIAANGAIGLSGANYGTSGQVLTSQGSGSAVQWATPSSPLTRSTNAGPLSGNGNYDFTLPANCFKVEFVGHNISTSGSGTPAFRLGTSAGILASGHYNYTKSGTGDAYRGGRDQIDPFDTNLNAGSDTGEIFMTFSSSSSSNMWIFHGMANRRTQSGNMFVMGVPDLGGNALTTIRFYPHGTGFDTGRFGWTAYTTS